MNPLISEAPEITSIDLATMSYVVEFTSRGTLHRSVVAVAPTDGGSTVSVTFRAERRGRLAKLAAKAMANAFESVTRPAVQQDLDDIVTAAERA